MAFKNKYESDFCISDSGDELNIDDFVPGTALISQSLNETMTPTLHLSTEMNNNNDNNYRCNSSSNINFDSN